MRKVVLIVLLLALIGGGYLGWLYSTTFRTTGKAAVRAMNNSERIFLDQRLARIPAGATHHQVEEILGAPYRHDPADRPSWRGPHGDTSSRVNVYFSNGRAFQIRWVKLGVFFWEKNLLRR